MGLIDSKKFGLNPIIDSNTKVMILGSLPGDESIRLQEYYANNNNDFWKLTSHAISEDITKFSYKEKIQKLLKNNIGLWDVFKLANRPGSLDSDINYEEINDFKWLKNNYPKIKLISFNGKKAGKYTRALNDIGYETIVIPSSSCAKIKIKNRA